MYLDFSIKLIDRRKIKIDPTAGAYSKNDEKAEELLDLAEENHEGGCILVLPTRTGLDACVLSCLGPVKTWDPEPRKGVGRVLRATHKLMQVEQVDSIEGINPGLVLVLDDTPVDFDCPVIRLTDGELKVDQQLPRIEYEEETPDII